MTPPRIEDTGTRHKLRPTFQTPWDEYAEHVGKRFTLLAMIWTTPEQSGWENPEPFFEIELEDGTILPNANAEEVFEGWLADESHLKDAPSK